MAWDGVPFRSSLNVVKSNFSMVLLFNSKIFAVLRGIRFLFFDMLIARSIQFQIHLILILICRTCPYEERMSF
jgi:hypothetical protein